MSADNGIYILKTPKGKKYEYRVTEAGAIENVYDDDHYPKKKTDAYRVMYFGRSKVYTSEDVALKEAWKISKECYTEYGINLITFNEPFPSMTQDEAEKIIRG